MEEGDKIAVTSIWKIDNKLKRVIDYISNTEKTYSSDINFFSSLEVEDNDISKEEKLLVSGINCSSENIYKEMMLTKERFNKKDGILAFHSIQSFNDNNLTPELVHKIGIQFAKEVWGDRFEVLVCTHRNTNHYHNHFVINSVSFIDGKKYYANKSSYAFIRRVSDSLCEEYGLSVVNKKESFKYNLNKSDYFEKDNYYIIAKSDIDTAIENAKNYSDFEKQLKIMNYIIIYRNNKLSIRSKNYKRNIRVERYFGEDYSVKNIIKRINNLYIQKPTKNSYTKTKSIKRNKKNNLIQLYYHYLYILGLYKDNPKYFKYSKELKKDIYKMNKISKEFDYLGRNKLETNEDIEQFIKLKKEQLNFYKDKREKLWKKYKKVENITKEQIKKELNQNKKLIDNLKIDVKICEDIINRRNNINKNINEIEKEVLVDYEYVK